MKSISLILYDIKASQRFRHLCHIAAEQGCKLIGSDFACTISRTVYFSRIRSGTDQMQILIWIYRTADSNWKRCGLRPETRIFGKNILS
jgi:CRISPR/Cas system-associated endoribonuclease Cas2